MTTLLSFGIVALASFGITWAMREYTLRKGIIDIPNARSSHSVPTPRGGGMAVAIMLPLGILLVTLVSPATRSAWRDLWPALVGGGLMVSAVGWLDDKRGVPVRTRLLVHLAAAAWAVGWLRGMPTLQLGFGSLHIGILGHFLAVFGIIWSINLYNFMDGIDGLAAGEGFTVAMGGAAFLFWTGNASLTAACLVLAGAILGFLVWNWPPAKIFMGDVGSGLLGFCFGTLAVASEDQGAIPVVVWIILLAVFVVDATATLVSRVLRRERWYEAHRTHAYQMTVQRGLSHRCVTSGILVIDVALWGIALCTVRSPRLLLPILSMVVLALTGVWYRLHIIAATGMGKNDSC